MYSSTPTKQCLQRLQKELRALQKEPHSYFVAAPDPHNILIWWVRITGPPDTCYAGGYYLTQIRFPADYPFKPPSIKMCTPSGRFKTDTDICLSNSSFHPEEWSPMWSVNTIITGMISFFVSKEKAMGTIEGSESERKNYAKESRTYNVRRLGAFYRRSLPEAYMEDLKYVEMEENREKHLPDHENIGGSTTFWKRGVRSSQKGNLHNLDGKISTPAKIYKDIKSTVLPINSSSDVLVRPLHSSSDQISLNTNDHPSKDMMTSSWRSLAVMTVFLAAVLGLFCCTRGH
ncbi:unnamed protein product [Phytomonas sp. Hart1]|nr:unnamed protein product [Phytomonas sp. Hart1]|eukprot:CCW67591.1 unnamed protein product [Phytomonas sp. isolate Hart1]